METAVKKLRSLLKSTNRKHFANSKNQDLFGTCILISCPNNTENERTESVKGNSYHMFRCLLLI